MPKYIWDSKLEQLVTAEEYYFDRYLQVGDKQATLGNKRITMNFISDTMEPTRHMANGKYYTSKKAFRAATKDAGCIEIGNDTKSLLKPRKKVKLDRRQRREDIKKAIHDLKNGNTPRGTGSTLAVY